MIELTRLNGNPLYVNCDLIKWAEAAPDTMLTLISGEKVVVRESCAEVVERIVGQRVRLLAEVVKSMPASDALLRILAAETIATPLIRATMSEARRSALGQAEDKSQAG
jgi:flagellar protein FlbD